jgi:hypothetical protein
MTLVDGGDTAQQIVQALMRLGSENNLALSRQESQKR